MDSRILEIKLTSGFLVLICSLPLILGKYLFLLRHSSFISEVHGAGMQLEEPFGAIKDD